MRHDARSAEYYRVELNGASGRFLPVTKASIRRIAESLPTNPPFHPAARLGLVGEFRSLVPDPFEGLVDVLRVFTAEILKDERVGSVDVTA